MPNLHKIPFAECGVDVQKGLHCAQSKQPDHLDIQRDTTDPRKAENRGSCCIAHQMASVCIGLTLRLLFSLKLQMDCFKKRQLQKIDDMKQKQSSTTERQRQLRDSLHQLIGQDVVGAFSK